MDGESLCWAKERYGLGSEAAARRCGSTCGTALARELPVWGDLG